MSLSPGSLDGMKTSRMIKKTRIVVLDDHFVASVGLRGPIDLDLKLDMAVMEASNGEQAVALSR